MRLEDVKNALAAHEAELKERGVKSLAVFGSVARGYAGPDSDVDLLVEFDRATGIFALLNLQRRLEEILGYKVDLVSRAGVHPALRDRILSEAVDAL